VTISAQAGLVTRLPSTRTVDESLGGQLESLGLGPVMGPAPRIVKEDQIHA